MRPRTLVLPIAALLVTAAPALAVEVSVLDGTAYATAHPNDDPTAHGDTSRAEVGTPGPGASATTFCDYSGLTAPQSGCFLGAPVDTGTGHAVAVYCDHRNWGGQTYNRCFLTRTTDGVANSYSIGADVPVTGGLGQACVSGGEFAAGTIVVLCRHTDGMVCAVVPSEPGRYVVHCFRPEVMEDGACLQSYTTLAPTTCARNPRVEEERGGACAVVDVNGAPRRVACLVP